MTTYKHPPTFERKDYSQWKFELWQMFTDINKARQGIALALSLEGKVREIAISIDKSLLTTEDEKTVLSLVKSWGFPRNHALILHLAGRINTSTVEDLKRLNKIIKRINSDHVSLKFQSFGKNLEIHVFTNASFGNLQDGGSQEEHFIITKGNNQKMNPVSWRSHKIKRVC